MPHLLAEAARPALGGLHALAQLLNCADPKKWATMGGPGPRELGTLLFGLHGELCTALNVEPTSDPPDRT